MQGSCTQCGPCLAYSQRLQRSGSQGTTCSPALTHPHLPHLQNGLAAGLASIDVLKGRSLLWTRVVLLLINVPLITLGARPNGLDLKVLEVRQEAGGRSREAGRLAGRDGRQCIVGWACEGIVKRMQLGDSAPPPFLSCASTPPLTPWPPDLPPFLLPSPMPPQLFLIANMVCCTSAIPVLLGLVSRLHRFVGGASMVFSCLLSILLTSGAWWVHGCPVLMYVHKLCARSETCDTNNCAGSSGA